MPRRTSKVVTRDAPGYVGHLKTEQPNRKCSSYEIYFSLSLTAEKKMHITVARLGKNEK